MSFTIQQTLTRDAPLILDSTCSDKKIWPRFATFRIDIRRDVNPDICASAAYLPFRDSIFQEIYCDPPHRIKGNRNWKQIDYPRFSYWENESQWLSFIRLVNLEFTRVLVMKGRLHLKITKGSERGSVVKEKSTSELKNFELLVRKEIESKGYFSRINQKNGGKPAYTLYLTYTKAKILDKVSVNIQEITEAELYA